MKTFINFLQRYGYSIFLGIALYELNVQWYKWQFCAVLVPLVILVEWRARK